jgi:hypothetical protein
LIYGQVANEVPCDVAKVRPFFYLNYNIKKQYYAKFNGLFLVQG